MDWVLQTYWSAREWRGISLTFSRRTLVFLLLLPLSPTRYRSSPFEARVGIKNSGVVIRVDRERRKRVEGEATSVSHSYIHFVGFRLSARCAWLTQEDDWSRSSVMQDFTCKQLAYIDRPEYSLWQIPNLDDGSYKLHVLNIKGVNTGECKYDKSIYKHVWKTVESVCATMAMH
jgi:hypothetical protein